MLSFQEKVYGVVRKIPKGKVLSYGRVAALAGRARAGRAVGNILNKNPNSRVVPCHRVIKADGRVGGYKKGTKRKIALLKKEGAVIERGKVA